MLLKKSVKIVSVLVGSVIVITLVVVLPVYFLIIRKGNNSVDGKKKQRQYKKIMKINTKIIN